MTNPNAREMIPIIAKIIGEISAAVATGKSTVPNIIIVGIASINNPKNKNKNAITNNVPNVPNSMLTMNSMIKRGTL